MCSRNSQGDWLGGVAAAATAASVLVGVVEVCNWFWRSPSKLVVSSEVLAADESCSFIRQSMKSLRPVQMAGFCKIRSTQCKNDLKSCLQWLPHND